VPLRARSVGQRMTSGAKRGRVAGARTAAQRVSAGGLPESLLTPVRRVGVLFFGADEAGSGGPNKAVCVRFAPGLDVYKGKLETLWVGHSGN
jgi:hypothetical protein